MEENKLEIKNESSIENIKTLIFTIRGKQVMLDSDVAMLYHYTTKRINETVSRNKMRFPENFCFQLNTNEYEMIKSQFVTTEQNNNTDFSLRSQIATLNIESNRGKHRKYLAYVFTEQGIAMLSSLLKNEIAIQVSINIMNAFVEMRKFLMQNGNIFERLTSVEYKLIEHDKKFDNIFNKLQLEDNIKQRIFFDGQIFDAYSLIIDIIKRAKKKIVIIDNIEMYHLGASIKDLGKKCFGINKIEDTRIINSILNLK